MPKLPWTPWHKVVRLREDLRSGERPLHMFGADLYEVLMQGGKRPVYEDPKFDVEKGMEVWSPGGKVRTLKHPWSVLAYEVAGEEAVESVVKEDAAELLRRRFFTPESIRDHNAFRPHVQAALKGIFDLDEQTKKQGADAEERYLKSYPFHPDLTEVFYTKWTQINRFQKARGVLRTFALALREAETWDMAPLVGLDMLLNAPATSGAIPSACASGRWSRLWWRPSCVRSLSARAHSPVTFLSCWAPHAPIGSSWRRASCAGPRRVSGSMTSTRPWTTTSCPTQSIKPGAAYQRPSSKRTASW